MRRMRSQDCRFANTGLAVPACGLEDALVAIILNSGIGNGGQDNLLSSARKGESAREHCRKATGGCVIRRFNNGHYELLQGMQVCDPPITRIAALGVYLPERVVDNDEIAKMVDAPKKIKALLPSLIERLTGCKTRHYAPLGT
jgi:hypothetical protein